MRMLLANIFSITCAGASFYLLLNDREGWGWFLFVAVICFSVPKYVKEK